MIWVGLGLVLLALAVPIVRALVGLLLMVAVVGVVGLGLFWWQQQRVELREVEASKARLPLANLDILNLRLESWTGPLTGRIVNRDPNMTLTQFDVDLQIRECSAPTCPIVAEDDVKIRVSVPPSQARDFSAPVSFPFLAPTTVQRQWFYEVRTILADAPPPGRMVKVVKRYLIAIDEGKRSRSFPDPCAMVQHPDGTWQWQPDASGGWQNEPPPGCAELRAIGLGNDVWRRGPDGQQWAFDPTADRAKYSPYVLGRSR